MLGFSIGTLNGVAGLPRDFVHGDSVPNHMVCSKFLGHDAHNFFSVSALLSSGSLYDVIMDCSSIYVLFDPTVLR